MIAASMASVCRLVCGTTSEWRCDPWADAQRIYFANHASHLDFVVIWASLPAARRAHVRPVAGRDYWEASALRRYLAADVFHAVLVERNRRRGEHLVAAAQASIARIAGEMGAEDSIIVFPEGTRSADGDVGVFRSGLYHLSRARPDAELVPVWLDNLNRILPKGEALPVPMLSRVVFGPVWRGQDLEKSAFLDAARRALLDLAEPS